MLKSPEDTTLFFDVAIVDECGQALEACSFIPILQAKRCVLAGDHYQLPPTITGGDNFFKDDPMTLLDRIAKDFNSENTTMLSIQYRMNSKISEYRKMKIKNNEN